MILLSHTYDKGQMTWSNCSMIGAMRKLIEYKVMKQLSSGRLTCGLDILVMQSWMISRSISYNVRSITNCFPECYISSTDPS